MSNPSGIPDSGATPPAAQEDFDPYYKWLGIPPDEQPPNYYRLLGLNLFETDHDVIESAADRQMAHLRRFAGGRRAELSQKVLNEVAAAQSCLLDDPSRAAYDGELRKKMPAAEEQDAPKGKRRSAWPDGKQPKNLDEFIKCLVASRLFTRSQADEFIAGLAAERRPKDQAAMAKELVQAKKLTKYQAACIYQGRPFHLLFGQYEVVDRVGVGGMGQVYKAQHRQLHQLRAVKVLSSKSLQSERAVERFRREVKMAAALAHPNIVATHDADEEDGEQYLVMEYVEGRDVAAILKQQGPFPVDQGIEIVIQAARGLEYTHSKGIIHRDIKPGNVMQTHDGIAKISDLGLARLNEDPMAATGNVNAAKLTMPGQIIGTVDYMSPEQAVDTHSADARSDIYSLGCTMYRILTGELPYPAQTKMQKLMAHRSTPIPSLREKRPEIPAAIDEVFQRMVAKEPADRYQSMTDTIAALENARSGGPPTPVRRPEPRPAPAAPLAPEPSSDGMSDSGPLPMSAPANPQAYGGQPAAPVPGQPATPQPAQAATPVAGAPAEQQAREDFVARHPEFANSPELEAADDGENTVTRQLGGLVKSSVHDRLAGRSRRSSSGGNGLSPVALVAIGTAIGVIVLLAVLVVVLIIRLNAKQNNLPGTPAPPTPNTSSIRNTRDIDARSQALPGNALPKPALPAFVGQSLGLVGYEAEPRHQSATPRSQPPRLCPRFQAPPGNARTCRLCRPPRGEASPASNPEAEPCHRDRFATV